MKQIKIKRGLDLPITGEPVQTIEPGPPIRRVALVGGDYVGLKPTMHVSEGDTVQLGQPLFSDKTHPAIKLTAPGSGTVTAIHRGNKRALQSVVIDLQEAETAVRFTRYARDELTTLTPDAIKDHLLASGQWAALRARPFSKVANPDALPIALFVTAMDTNPLAADPAIVIATAQDAFLDGLTVLARLFAGKKYVCLAPGANIPALPNNPYEYVCFAGPHPAGLVGTHIHFLAPVSAKRSVWYLDYQDVIAIGKLFTTGQLWTERVIALGGPSVQRPRLLRTRLGASTEDLLQNELKAIAPSESSAIETAFRAISGSVWSGRRAAGWASYLGRYHRQLSVLPEGGQRELLGWTIPSPTKFSVSNVFLSAWQRRQRRFDLNTSQHGSPRAMVPVNYEAVMPLRVLATQLLRALLVRDTDSAQALGCLELDEEDLALCSFVCVGKYDYGPTLRANLSLIEKEG